MVPIDGRDLGLVGSDDVSLRQRPFAAVLGCADARVPIELIFNEGPNDLFVVRVAGNALGDDVRSSLNYAIEHLGESLQLIVVLGHSACGAVTAAADIFLDPASYLALASKHSIRALIDRLQVIVEGSAKKMAEAFGSDVVRHPNYREALIEVAMVSTPRCRRMRCSARSPPATRAESAPPTASTCCPSARSGRRGAGRTRWWASQRRPTMRRDSRVRRRGAALAAHRRVARVMRNASRMKRLRASATDSTGVGRARVPRRRPQPGETA